jgi:hypothetical protein
MSKHVDEALNRLAQAVRRRRSTTYCLGLWSAFVRARDGHRCVLCHGNGNRRLSAHHIARKCFLAAARLDAGNGITLCHQCHAGSHAAFNRRSDLAQPMDAQGGENIDLMTFLYRALAEDAIERNQRREDYYYLSQDVLRTFKRFQQLPDSVRFPGTPVEQAYAIWRQTPRAPLFALLEANGLTLPRNFIQPPGSSIVLLLD